VHLQIAMGRGGEQPHSVIRNDGVDCCLWLSGHEDRDIRFAGIAPVQRRADPLRDLANAAFNDKGRRGCPSRLSLGRSNDCTKRRESWLSFSRWASE
jgi:hypothetical protein